MILYIFSSVSGIGPTTPENAKLGERVANRPKYRESSRITWKSTQAMFLESIYLYSKNWSKMEQIELRYLSDWED